MDNVKNEVLRMELQVGELIRIVANLNERLAKIEDVKQKVKVRQSSCVHKVR